ncbi:hypothetical protein JTP77_023955 [Streptomyces sp. S9]|nr:hypothetical protein [Streptomyces sp. S9]
MSGEPFSIADAEATFGPENSMRVRQCVADAPPHSPEQREYLKRVFALARLARPESEKL